MTLRSVQILEQELKFSQSYLVVASVVPDDIDGFDDIDMSESRSNAEFSSDLSRRLDDVLQG